MPTPVPATKPQHAPVTARNQRPRVARRAKQAKSRAPISFLPASLEIRTRRRAESGPLCATGEFGYPTAPKTKRRARPKRPHFISLKFRRVPDDIRPRLGEIAATGPAFVLEWMEVGPYAPADPHRGVPNPPFPAPHRTRRAEVWPVNWQ